MLKAKEAAIKEMDVAIKLQDADLRKYEKQIESLREQLNNMEACYIGVKKERDEAVGKVSELGNLLDKALEELDEVSGSNLDRGAND